ncbi:hypothetical protein I7I51_09136 [Histoplasma capsulatum]|uniref:SnoaL-like domain-containing protein n=1 Tax=Ajellomyces capsulatus TaxID=5037 RepID=A0A8A1M2Y4_AJECA|nr:hypothetical protein I7I51_09136 [Histoplasma capsulatum]
MASPSKRLETAKKFIANFSTLSTETLEAILAENFVYQFAPASMNPPGPFDKKGLIQHISGIHAILSGIPVTAKEYVESESSNQVTVWATSQAIFREELKVEGLSEAAWALEGELVFLLWMDETGAKLVKIVEFLDSQKMVTLLELVQRAKENKAKNN